MYSAGNSLGHLATGLGHGRLRAKNAELVGHGFLHEWRLSFSSNVDESERPKSRFKYLFQGLYGGCIME